jgi:hypothetical protein
MMKFNIPHSVQVEHEELHAELEKAVASGGETGAAARKVAEAVHAHFESEENYALPPLGLLPVLAEGRISSEMAQVVEMTDMLKAEMPHMLEEHKAIVASLQKLIKAASQEKKTEHIHFAEKLMLHARNEEEVLYPAAILIGEYVRLVLDIHGLEHA